jgi:hypothetical protein
MMIVRVFLAINMNEWDRKGRRNRELKAPARKALAGAFSVVETTMFLSSGVLVKTVNLSLCPSRQKGNCNSL